jgi:uncharacterized protein (DUF924 family)
MAPQIPPPSIPPDAALPDTVVAFWQSAGPEAWFGGGPLLDAEIAIRFEAEVRRACEILRHGPHPWEREARSAMALLILTDQFPRNIYRGLTDAWACDPLARGAAARMIDAGLDREIEGPMRVFFYLPFSHSESMNDQERCVALTEAAFGKDSEFARHARAHRRMLEQFGRFPERNAVLGRPTSDAEQDWIRQGGYDAEVKREAV